MERKYDGAYAYRLKGMDRASLLYECNKMRMRLDKLSEICDVEDVYTALKEQSYAEYQLQKQNEAIEKAIKWMRNELFKRGIKTSKNIGLEALTERLIKSDKEDFYNPFKSFYKDSFSTKDK